MKVRLSLPFAPESAGDGRRAVRESLRAAEVAPQARGDLELAAHELLANALRHGRPRADGSVELELRRTARRVRIRVTDGGTGAPFAPADPETAPSTPAPGGYGLLIAAAVGRVVIRRGATGTCVSLSATAHDR